LRRFYLRFIIWAKRTEKKIIEDIGGEEVLKEFKKRLQQLGVSCQDRIKKLSEATRTIKEIPTSPKAVAMKCAQNIQAIIKDLFYPKPQFKASLAASWKFGSSKSTVISLNKPASTHSTTVNGNGLSTDSVTTAQSDGLIPGTKRKLITAPEKDPEDLKKQKKVYTPPSGKYTATKSNFRNFGNGKRRNNSARNVPRGAGINRNNRNTNRSRW